MFQKHCKRIHQSEIYRICEYLPLSSELNSINCSDEAFAFVHIFALPQNPFEKCYEKIRSSIARIEMSAFEIFYPLICDQIIHRNDTKRNRQQCQMRIFDPVYGIFG